MMIPNLDQFDLGRRIALARRHRGITQTELSARLNLYKTTLAKMEQGKRPSLETLYRIITILDVSSDYLLGRIDIFQRSIDKDVVSIPKLSELLPEDIDLVKIIVDILVERRKVTHP